MLEMFVFKAVITCIFCIVIMELHLHAKLEIEEYINYQFCVNLIYSCGFLKKC